MAHAWWHPWGTSEDNFFEWVTGGGDPGPVDPIAQILRKEDEAWKYQDAWRARTGHPQPPPPWTLTEDERRRQILAEKPISQGGTLVTEDVVRGWKHENQIMELFQQGIINEEDTKKYLMLWFTNPDLEDGTKHWPDRPSIDTNTAEGIAEGRKLSFDAFDGTIALWEATGQEIPPNIGASPIITPYEDIRQMMEGRAPLGEVPPSEITTTTTGTGTGTGTGAEMTQAQWNALTKEEKDWYWDNEPLVAQKFEGGGGGGGGIEPPEDTGEFATTGVDTGAGYYDTITGQWVKGDLSPDEIRRQTRIAQEADYGGMQDVFNQFLTTQPMHALSGYGQEAARAMQQPLYYSYLAGRPMPGEARDEMLFHQFLNQEGGPQIMDPTAYTQRLLEIGGYMGGEPPTEAGALAEWERAQAPYRRNIDAFNAWLQPAMYNVAPAFRSGVRAAAQNVYDRFMEATPEQSFMAEMARTEGLLPSSMVTGGY